ncbi:MAG: DNA helicase II [Dehalococcoidia bacterium]|nr:DNA helicase II [Chloroflexota bacterium]
MNSYAIFGPPWPGTGKTTELLRLVADAKERGFDANEIGFFSFTRAAASEALKRLDLRSSNKICTLHSLCFRALGASPMGIVDSYKLRKFGSKVGISFAGVSNEEYGDRMEEGDKYLAILNLARSCLTDPATEYYRSDERPGDFSQFKFFVDSYAAWKEAFGYFDFSDLLERYVMNPTDHGASVVFVDEAQDLSPLQWAVVDRIASFDRVRELTIAGDDDQAIYEWAGADPAGMSGFVDRYNAQPSTLAQSYRVPAPVHSLARGIVSRIKTRVQKRYRAATHAGEVNVFRNGFSTDILGGSEDTLILCRSHVSKKEVESALVAARIPYRVESGRPGLFESRWADAVRAVKKLQAGGSIGSSELEVLAKVGTSLTKEALNRRDMKAIATAGYERAVAIPFEHVEFFREAKLDAEPTIRVSTIHSAKGREADRVILHCGITARTESAMERNPDQEHRVFYVAVTRAKRRLDLITGFDNDYEVMQ